MNCSRIFASPSYFFELFSFGVILIRKSLTSGPRLSAVPTASLDSPTAPRPLAPTAPRVAAPSPRSRRPPPYSLARAASRRCPPPDRPCPNATPSTPRRRRTAVVVAAPRRSSPPVSRRPTPAVSVHRARGPGARAPDAGRARVTAGRANTAHEGRAHALCAWDEPTRGPRTRTVQLG
jgi:hypothetical protein